MKKLIILPLITLLLCGCAQKSVVSPVLNNISFIAEIDYGDNEFIANAKLAQDVLNIVITEPQEIKDLTLNITKNGVTAEFRGITYTPDINSLPQGAIVQILYEVLNDIRASQNTAVCGEENCSISGKAEGYKYDFEFSPSGLPISLKVYELDLEIDFKNVTVN